MHPENDIRRWIRIAVFNLFILAIAGTLLRYKIAFALPWVDQKYLLHAHSHFAFSGWLTQVLMTLMVYVIARLKGIELLNRFRPVLFMNLVSAYGMLLSFPFGGYQSVSVTFSTLSIVAGAWFAVVAWREMNRNGSADSAFLWFKAALFFMVLSSAGPFALSYMMAHNNTDIRLHLIAEYFFLHFQYNGWFLFTGMGVLYFFLPADVRNSKMLRNVWLLFVTACVPAYLLSVLWMNLYLPVYILVVLAALAQVTGWIILLPRLRDHLQPRGLARLFWLLAAVAFTVKLLLQAGSTIPELSHFAFGYRPVVIGYLHLMLLGVCTFFVLGACFNADLLIPTRTTRRGAWLFITGVILNELLLFVQGVTAIIGTYLENVQYWLFGVAVILMTGAFLLIAGQRWQIKS